ncbi:MAG: DUF4384 domain-containing protein [Hyphomicrobiaceae bacterium]
MSFWRGACTLLLSVVVGSVCLGSGADFARAQQPLPASPPAPVAPPAQPATDPAPDGTPDLIADQLAEAAKRLAFRPLQPPEEPKAAAAYAVFDKHCARCHQGGKLELPSPAGAFGNILRLDEIAHEPDLVQPGNPEGSRLYVSMLRRLMPIEVDEESRNPPRPLPSAAEIGDVRAWIAGLPPTRACEDRDPVTAGSINAAMQHAAGEKTGNARSLRFVSLAHLYNACASREQMAAYRQGLFKLFNSLSWKQTPVILKAINESRTVYSLDLNDLGWLPQHWERIVETGQPFPELIPATSAGARKRFHTQHPLVRGDWLVSAVLRAPLYYDILAIPGTGPEILKILQIDTVKMRQAGAILRYPFKASGFAQEPSLAERLVSRYGALWSSYYTAAHSGAPDLSQLAGKPADALSPFTASKVMLTLPNGLNAFAIVGQRGDRLDELPPDIAWPAAMLSGNNIRAGIDCFACHSSGPIGTPNGELPGSAVAGGDSAAQFEKDRAALASASRRLGLLPNASLDGVEPLTLLSDTYEKPVGAVRAAAELRVDAEALLALADKDQKPPSIMARRLLQGVVAREDFEKAVPALLSALGQPAAAAAAGKRLEHATQAAAAETGDATSRNAGDPPQSLVLYSDKARYKTGDKLQLVVKALADCHLTVISIDREGLATVIYPSDFETGTLVTAGSEIHLPAANAPYSFRLNKPGREHVVALCNEATANTDNIFHDFERQRFTDLGNYANYVLRNASGLTNGAQAAVPRYSERRRRGARRRGGPTGEPAQPEEIYRTGITIIVE